MWHAKGIEYCHQLKMPASDGKMRKTDVADTEQLFCIIQSVASPKAEAFKQWMAQVASKRLDQMQDPEQSIEQAMLDYKRLGYSDNWILVYAFQNLKPKKTRMRHLSRCTRRGSFLPAIE